jgi:hypothetical protein
VEQHPNAAAAAYPQNQSVADLAIRVCTKASGWGAKLWRSGNVDTRSILAFFCDAITRYFFPVRQGDIIGPDFEGMQPTGIEEAWQEAAGPLPMHLKTIFEKKRQHGPSNGNRGEQCQRPGVNGACCFRIKQR